MTVSNIAELLNSLLLIFLVYAVLFGKKANTKRLIALEERIDELEKQIAERDEVLDSSQCFQGARVALLLNKELNKPSNRKNPDDILRKLKNMFGEDVVNVRKTTLDINSDAFKEEIVHLDTAVLKQLLIKMTDAEQYRQAEVIRQVLEARGVK